MSKKSIEVLSIHAGDHNFTLPDGEERTVTFEQQDDGNCLAKVDEDEAAHLLGIGEPNYFQAKQVMKSLEEIINSDPAAAAAAAKITGKKGKAEPKAE